MAQKERNISVDVLRCLACMLIAMVHSTKGAPESYGAMMTAISLFGGVGIGIFLFISGYLLLPVKIDTVSFLKHRFSRLLWPLLIWSVVYYALDLAEGQRVARWADALSLVLSGGTPIMWFMYVILGLYLVSPLVSPWLEKTTRREADIYLVISLLPYLIGIFVAFGVISTGTDTLYYFMDYGPYFFFGWYVKRFGWRFKLRWYGLAFLLAILSVVAWKTLRWQADFYDLFWIQSLCQFAIAAFISHLVMGWPQIYTRLGHRVRGLLTTVSNLTLGVYMLHFIVARRLLWHWSWIDGIESFPLQTLVVVGLTLLISLGVGWLISLTPLGKYVIGYSRR